MAENVFDIGVGTGVDTSGLEKGLSDAEKEILDTAAKLTQETEKAAQEQIDIIKETEQKKIEEIQKSIDEQIRLAKEKPGLDPSVLKAEIDAIKQAGSARIKETQTSSQLEQQIISNAAKNKIKILQDYAKKQVTTLKDGNKKSLQSIKDFTKGAVGELMGLDQVLGAVAGGPVALGKLFVDLGKKAVAALNEAAGAWREQEQAEVALTNAAKNNPYLNDRAVKQLNQFANEMQRMTGLDSVMITQTQTRLASLGRNQQQIKDILKVAADMAASGVMDFDSAVNELNNSLNGMVKTSGRLYPELKNLSKEALASGQAIEIIGQKVAGSAAEAMKTGEGAITAYKNEIGNLKKIIGEDWENATKGFRAAITNYIKNIVDARIATKELKAAIDAIKSGSSATDNFLTVEQNALDELINKQKMYQEIINDPRYASRYKITVNEAKEGIKTIGEEIKLQEELVKKLNERVEIEHAVAEAVERAKKARAAEETVKTIELENRALENQLAVKRMLEQGNRAAAKAARDMALQAAAEAEAEVKKIQALKESEEKAKNFREENQKALDLEIEKIYRKAELEGKSRDSLEVQKQVLDANVQAYENLLAAARAYIEGATQSEEERSTFLNDFYAEEQGNFTELKRRWAAYDERAKKEKEDEEDRKKRLADLIKLQEDLAGKLKKISEDAVAEGKNLYDTQKEQNFQNELAEIRKKSITDAAKFEAGYREQQRYQEYQGLLRDAAEKTKLQKETLEKIRDSELEAAGNNSERKKKIEEKFNSDVEELDKNLIQTRQQLESNYLEQKIQAEKEALKTIEQAHVDMYQRLLSKAQEYLNAASSIASSISTIWTNNIDYETDEKLRANDKIIQSDEDRAAAEKKIQIEAANERYKAELFAWSTNVIMATANAAMAVLNALNTQPFYVGLAMAALSTAVGAMQVAAVISAKPKPPRFHSGGVVQGTPGSEQHVIAKAGEPILTQKQFQNTMQAISNLANTKMGTGVQMNVKIENNASNKVKAEPQMTADGFRLVITEIVNEGFGNGTFDHGLAVQQNNLRGPRIL